MAKRTITRISEITGIPEDLILEINETKYSSLIPDDTVFLIDGNNIIETGSEAIPRDPRIIGAVDGS